MEKEIVIIKEEEYQKVKKLLSKENDFYTKQEFDKFNAIFNATPQIFLDIDR